MGHNRLRARVSWKVLEKSWRSNVEVRQDLSADAAPTEISVYGRSKRQGLSADRAPTEISVYGRSKWQWKRQGLGTDEAPTEISVSVYGGTGLVLKFQSMAGPNGSRKRQSETAGFECGRGSY